MNKTFTHAAAFLVGAAIGSATAWYYLKDKYAKIAQEEIDSVKEVFGRSRKPTAEVEEQKPEPDKETLDESKKIIEKLDYTSYTKQTTDNEKEVAMKEDKPYVITPQEFGEYEDYEQISLTFFSDQIIVDDGYEILEDVDRVIGFDSLNHFGEYEDDSVYVRNDRLKCDYEILLDTRTYSEVVKSNTHPEAIL